MKRYQNYDNDKCDNISCFCCGYLHYCQPIGCVSVRVSGVHLRRKFKCLQYLELNKNPCIFCPNPPPHLHSKLVLQSELLCLLPGCVRGRQQEPDHHPVDEALPGGGRPLVGPGLGGEEGGGGGGGGRRDAGVGGDGGGQVGQQPVPGKSHLLILISLSLQVGKSP